jgi:hypothetical protein
LGHWDRARELLTRPSRRGAPRQSDEEHCYAQMGELLLREGRLDEARRLLEGQLPAPQGQEDTHAHRPQYASLIRIYLALGSADEAIALLEQRDRTEVVRAERGRRRRRPAQRLGERVVGR